MTRYIVKVFLALGLAVFVYSIGMPGCSPTQFGSLKTVSCEDFSSRFRVESCEVIDSPDTPIDRLSPKRERSDRERPSPKERSFTPRVPPPPPKDLLEFNYRVSLGKVDIIFVIDNSSSMAKEHRSLASQFSTFLTNIRNVDYHIAVITTDISSSPGNSVRNAYYQDGKFIPIGRRVYLRNENLGHRPSSNLVEDFKRAIAREETQRCDTSNQPRSSSGTQYDDLYRETESGSSVRCPSHDERGTYALNLAIRNQRHRSFFRSDDAHLMIVILSDEDIRSSKEYITQLGFDQSDHYAFEDFDYPEVLVESIKNRFPLKSFSVYPIIIIPGDSRCLSEQNRQRSQGEGTGRGFYGVEYARLAKARDPALKQHGNLLKGKLISICDRNYGSQLNKVAVEANTIKITLPCGEPESIDLFVNGQRVRVSHTIEERTLIIEPGRINLDSDLKVRVRCEAT